MNPMPIASLEFYFSLQASMSTKRMDDPTSPLLPSNFSEPENLSPNTKNLPSLNKMIEQSLGAFNSAQLFQSIVVSLAWVCDGQQSFISVYTDAQPAWHCTTNSTTCSPTSSTCALPSSAWAWNGPASKTTISEWSLECPSSFITGLPASSFFIGCLIGGLILGTLADSSLGRKNLLLISCLIMSVAALITSFSNNIWTYSALRFISGFGRALIGTCALVLLTENVGEKWRGRGGILGFFFFTCGFLSLPLVAYINRFSTWRVLYLWTSIPGIFYCSLLQFFVTKSPRWLFMRSREDEAMSVLKQIGSAVEDKSLTVYLLSLPHEQENKNHPKTTTIFSSMKTLFEKTWAFKRKLAVITLGTGIGFVYYGMPFGVGNLGFNIYLSVMFKPYLKIPSYFATYMP